MCFSQLPKGPRVPSDLTLRPQCRGSVCVLYIHRVAVPCFSPPPMLRRNAAQTELLLSWQIGHGAGEEAGSNLAHSGQRALACSPKLMAFFSYQEPLDQAPRRKTHHLMTACRSGISLVDVSLSSRFQNKREKFCRRYESTYELKWNSAVPVVSLCVVSRVSEPPQPHHPPRSPFCMERRPTVTP